MDRQFINPVNKFDPAAEMTDANGAAFTDPVTAVVTKQPRIISDHHLYLWRYPITMDSPSINLFGIYNPAAAVTKANNQAFTDPVAAAENAQFTRLLLPAMPDIGR
ncbi:hypothetical protein EDB81DRAFT_876261 [Dactylonectria macrodidyma]|uniref:Uncharacterized protein n=1 Tax=Dactylonectria macrodidyma TaxID=307937 RepID=A0A9P9FPI5_9HYPO|nr:hypothetical protein EDB81DRAFT_876261 [Dactylonectria macrodidyma]